MCQTDTKIGFFGYVSLKCEDEILGLAGVLSKVFQLLLKICKLNEKIDKRSHVEVEDKLLIFLCEMKTGLTFSAIWSLFGLHKTSVSKIFYDYLNYLSQACKNFVFWPRKDLFKN